MEAQDGLVGFENMDRKEKSHEQKFGGGEHK